MKIIIASNNSGKVREYKDIFEPLGYHVLSQSEKGIHLEVEETGTTFEENAALKEQIERYKAQEGAMLTTLETAKSLMSDISASAEKRAGILLKNAELDADLKLRKATEEVEKLRNEQDILTRKVSSIKTRLKSLLEGELKHIDEITDDIVTEFSMSERPRGLGEDSAFSRTDPFLKQLEDDLSSEPEDLLRPADLDTDLTRTRVVRG